MKKIIIAFLSFFLLFPAAAHSAQYVKITNKRGAYGIDFPVFKTVERRTNREFKNQTVSRPNKYMNCALNNLERAAMGKKKRNCNY